MTPAEIILVLLLHFIHVTGPDGQGIDIAADQIVSLREVRDNETIHHPEANCQVQTTDGKFIAVRESCQEVDALLDALYKRREQLEIERPH